MVLLVAVGVFVFWVTKKNGEVLPEPGNRGEIASFVVNEEGFDIETINISKVEIWALPTGTEVSEESAVFLGIPKLIGDVCLTLLSVGGDTFCSFRLAIPDEPQLFSEVYVIGRDQAGEEIARKYLPYTGATEIYEALWGSKEGEATQE